MSSIVQGKNLNLPFTLRYRDADGKQKERSFKTEREAKAFGRELGKPADPRNETLAEYAPRWLNEHPVGSGGRVKTPGYMRKCHRLFRIHILPELGGYRLQDLTLEICEKFLTNSLPTPALARDCKIHLSTVLNGAVKAGRITSNPASGVNVSYDDHRLVIPEISYAQLEIMEQNMPADARLALWVMYATGCRIGECMALREDSVLEGKVLRLEEQVPSDSRAAEIQVTHLKCRKDGEFRSRPREWCMG